MDTGNYMANKMDSLIENGLHQMDEFIYDLDNRIEAFIKENKYDYTIDEVVKEYIDKYSKGFYVSFTCKNIIDNFKDDLARSTGVSCENKS
jgi:hypothetical protein